MRPVRLAVVLVLLVGTYAASILGPPPSRVTLIGLGDIVFLLGVIALLAGWADQAEAARRDVAAASHPVR